MPAVSVHADVPNPLAESTFVLLGKLAIALSSRGKSPETRRASGRRLFKRSCTTSLFLKSRRKQQNNDKMKSK